MAIRPRPSRGSELMKGWRGQRLQIEIAKLLGIRPETYNRIEHGWRWPNLKFAHEIEEITNGAVPAASWIEPPLDATPPVEAKPRKKKRAAA